MTEVTVHVHGVRELRDALDDLAVNLSPAGLADESDAVGRLIASEAVGRAPRRTGELADSIQGDKTGIVATSDHAAPVHWGVPERGQTAQPFITDAVDATDHAWLAVYENAVHDAAAKVARSIRH